MRRLARLVLINAAVFIGLVALGAVAVLLIPWQRAEDTRSGKAALPNYDGSDWAPKLFREARLQSEVYYSYVGWRRTPFAGEMVNVVGEYGERLTVQGPHPKDQTVFFFGGSTMWGTGSRDVDTIPSKFAIRSGLKARNFGETAYTAHQSLEMLIRLLQDGERPAAVVFYDGVNDVVQKCRVELGAYSDAREAETRLAVEPSGAYRLFWSVIGKLSTLFSEQRLAEEYDCDGDPEKAAAVANALVSDWKIAAAVAELHGIRFYAALQPVIYFSRTRTDYLEIGLEGGMADQFQTVYPKVRALMAGTPFHDFTDAFDLDQAIYIDFCHSSPNGNEIIAARLTDLVAPDILADPVEPTAAPLTAQTPSSSDPSPVSGQAGPISPGQQSP